MVSGGAVCSAAVWMKLPLPIIWGVAASFVCLVVISLAGAKEVRPLLPGFDEQGQEIDYSILKACLFGTVGSLLISIGIGMWINWICIVAGVIGMYLCVTMIDRAFKKYMLPA